MPSERPCPCCRKSRAPLEAGFRAEVGLFLPPDSSNFRELSQSKFPSPSLSLMSRFRSIQNAKVWTLSFSFLFSFFLDDHRQRKKASTLRAREPLLVSQKCCPMMGLHGSQKVGPHQHRKTGAPTSGGFRAELGGVFVKKAFFLFFSSQAFETDSLRQGQEAVRDNLGEGGDSEG